MAAVEFPSFVTSHPIFKHHKVEKVFPTIGLSDASKKIDINPNELSLGIQSHRVVLDALLRNAMVMPVEKRLKLYDIVPLQGSYVEFTSSAFDIMTMSMRGLTSCIKWDGERRHTLVGSVIDPYCGMICINRGDTEYGSRIWYRSVVRLIQLLDKSYGLFLEKTYCHSEPYGAYARWIFKEFLAERCPLPIYTGNTEPGPVLPENATIPLSEPVKELIDYDYNSVWTENKGWVCYRDSNIKYGSKIDCDWTKIIPKPMVEAEKKESVQL